MNLIEIIYQADLIIEISVPNLLRVQEFIKVRGLRGDDGEYVQGYGMCQDVSRT